MIDTLAYPAEKLFPWLVETVGSGWLALVLLGAMNAVAVRGMVRVVLFFPKRMRWDEERARKTGAAAGRRARRSIDRWHGSRWYSLFHVLFLVRVTGRTLVAMLAPVLGLFGGLGLLVLLATGFHIVLIAYFWPWRSGDPAGAILLGALMSPDGLLTRWGVTMYTGGFLGNLAPLGQLVIAAYGIRHSLARKNDLLPSTGHKLPRWASFPGTDLIRAVVACVLYPAPVGYWIFSYSTWLVAAILRWWRRGRRASRAQGTSS